MIRQCLGAAVAAVLTAVTLGDGSSARAVEGDEAIVLSRASAVAYARYERAPNPGFFAISLDGVASAHIAHGGSWSDDAILAPLAQQAIAACEAEADGVQCMIFARNGEIMLAVPYEIPHD